VPKAGLRATKIAWCAAMIGLAGCAGTPTLVQRPVITAPHRAEEEPIPASEARVVRSQDPDTTFQGGTLPSYRAGADLPSRVPPTRPLAGPATGQPALPLPSYYGRMSPAATAPPASVPAATAPLRDYSEFGGRGISGPTSVVQPRPTPAAVLPPVAAPNNAYNNGLIAPDAKPWFRGQDPATGARTPAASSAGYGGRGESGPAAVAQRGEPEDVPPGQFPGSITPEASDVAPYATAEPDRWLNIDFNGEETETGRFMFGVGVNSDAGVVGNVVIDEQNFDWQRWPRRWSDFGNGTAFRGAGQRFRLEAAPGTQVSRYLVNFQEPYLLDTPVSFGVSGFYYNRLFNEWYEDRLGGRLSLGYQFPDTDLSVSGAVRYEDVTIYNPIVPTPPTLTAALGSSDLVGFRLGLIHDTRDSPFLATDGHYAEVSFEQVVGTFVYPRLEAEFRQYFLLHERPDTSGRHTLSVKGKVGITGNDTPIYEEYYAGGFSTIRGFNFRGVSPRVNGVAVGGDFLALASIEYMFPLTADDMLRAVTFVDAGTVETDVKLDNFRVAPGVGLRVTVPALGPAPIALDFAFPVADVEGDQKRTFSFFIGFGR